MNDFLMEKPFSFDNYPEMSVFPNFLEIEDKIQKFWKYHNILGKYLKKNLKCRDQFSFIDGPITANNPMGVHHAWGRTLKDIYIRFNTMDGKKARYQNGFDTQGLWVEVGVEKQLNLNSKREIYNYGLEPFKNACLERVHKYGWVITDNSKQLGQFMDWDNSYWTHTDNNILHIWYFLKKCHDNGWLYKGHKVMPWCVRCGTSLSQHEQSDSYRDTIHPSIYVSFPIKDLKSSSLSKLVKKKFPKSKPNMSLVVWTTTPWTLPANVAVAVNPDIEYVLLKPKENTREKHYWLILGKTSYKSSLWLEDYEGCCSFLGKDLVSVEVEGPCQSFVPAQKDIIVRVVSWKDVSEVEGSGIVHIAPGCGAEDYELGKENNLPVLAPLDESGNYTTPFGFDGELFSDVSKKVREKLHFRDKMLHDTTITHRYPVCWRCNEELVYRLVDEWFISTETIRPLLLETVELVKWDPLTIKARMIDWLRNMGDWCISRKRFWGLPLPFYECNKCNTLQVFGSVDSLRGAAGNLSVDEFQKLVPELHRPYIDSLVVYCPNCNNKVTRILDVGDCWLDAGIVPFSTLDYLRDHSEKSFWSQWFPADLVIEMREQVRLWFYSQLFMSVTLTGKPPFKFVQAYEKVLDVKGEAMHRSKGNAIWFYEALEQAGADPNRWFYTGWDIAKPLLYGLKNVKESTKPLVTFWSCVRFLQQNLQLTPNLWEIISQPIGKLSNQLDVWLVNEFDILKKLLQENYRTYKASKIVNDLSIFWDKLSTFWLRNSRERFWKVNSNDSDKLSELESLTAYQLLWQTTFQTLLYIAPIVPFYAEYLYQLLVRPLVSDSLVSIHLMSYKRDDSFPSLTITQLNTLQYSQDVLDVVELSRQLRNELKIKNRYLLPEINVELLNPEKELEQFQNWDKVLKNEMNTEKVIYQKPENSSETKSNQNRNWCVYIDPHVSKNLETKWLQADILRNVQYLRKKQNLPLTKEAKVAFKFDTNHQNNDVFSKEFEEKMLSEAFAELTSDYNEDWSKIRVKNLKLTIYLQPKQ
ncbi:MAG: class I tRNA ligase family protein [Candidatus Thorarchaeota archaeon]